MIRPWSGLIFKCHIKKSYSFAEGNRINRDFEGERKKNVLNIKRMNNMLNLSTNNLENKEVTQNRINNYTHSTTNI